MVIIRDFYLNLQRFSFLKTGTIACIYKNSISRG